MTNPPDRELAVFSAARQMPASERVAYLDEACAGDPTLRQRIEELLQASDAAGAFLKKPAALPIDHGGTVQMPVTLAEKPGDQIGHYKLLQQIGEGGCGVVYMAEQEQPVRRRVALKVIKLGMDTKNVIARFEAERQALALMDHPNIAKVLDAGATRTGRPYFVMELVRGIKITDYCDQHHLSTKERLDLFIKVCQAIQHAHQKGIIHRDIKPSNILVTMSDGLPLPKVIDFGIAKATHGKLTDQTLFTAFEQFIGTPAYMSPEQAEMSAQDIDTRSDIYSLGVLLYELLTGQTPFDAKKLLRAGLDEIRRTIREEEPAKPSTRLNTMLAGELETTARQRRTEPPRLVHLVRGDLDWIVMKALEKNRARRYETANGFAADIQRHLNDEPVVACPPSNVYKFQKLVRRNKLFCFAASSVAAALIFGLVVSTWMFFKEQQAHRQAETERKKAQVEAVKSQQVAQFLQEMLQGVGPSVALGRDTKLLEDILDKTAVRLNDLKDEPEAEVELRSTIADVYLDLGRYEKSEAMLRSELALRRKLVGNNDPQLAVSLEDLGVVLSRRGKLSEAESVDREALALNRKLFGNENSETINALGNLAIVIRDEGKLAEAETLHQEVLELRRKVLGNEHKDTITAMSNLATVLLMEDKLAEAEAIYRETLAARRKLLGNENPKVAFSLAGLSAVLGREGKFAEAESLAREAVDLRRKLLGHDHPDLAMSLNDLAVLLRSQGKPAEAEPLLREALTMQRHSFGTEHVYVAAALDNLSVVVRDGRGDLVEAESLSREAVKMFFDLVGTDRRETVKALNNLASTLSAEGKSQEAEATNEAALATCTNLFGGEPARVAALLDTSGQILRAEGKPQVAEVKLREALDLRRKVLNRDHPSLAESLYDLAQVLCDEGRFSESEALARECLAIREKWQPDGWPSSSARSLLGGSLLGQKKFAEAEPFLLAGFEELSQHKDKLPAIASVKLNEARERLIRLYEATNRPDEAVKLRQTLPQAQLMPPASVPH